MPVWYISLYLFLRCLEGNINYMYICDTSGTYKRKN